MWLWEHDSNTPFVESSRGIDEALLADLLALRDWFAVRKERARRAVPKIWGYGSSFGTTGQRLPMLVFDSRTLPDAPRANYYRFEDQYSPIRN